MRFSLTREVLLKPLQQVVNVVERRQTLPVLANLLVNVDGNIPASAACDSIRYLSGPWSAVYDAGAGAQKSDYTGRVSIQVTCP